MSLTPPSSLPNSEPAGFNVSITKEEYNLFYRVDRLLFTRLVVSLHRDISQSINVMAFIMWLERQAKDSNLVEKILQRWTDGMLSSLADEAVVVLDYIEFSRVPLEASTKDSLQFMSQILRRNVTLDFLYDQRLEIIAEITKLINDVCLRAFNDIVEQLNYGMSVNQQGLFHGNAYGAAAPAAAANVVPYHMNNNPQVVYFDPNSVVPIPMVAQQVVDPNAVQIVTQQVVDPYMTQNVVLEQFNGLGGIAGTTNNNEFGTYYGFNTHQNQIQPDINQVMANLNLGDIYAADNGMVAAHAGNDNGHWIEMRHNFDNRTLFMTFSKGYPVYETEIRDFFTRKFGDIIERLIMQETNPASEQSLYARLVVREDAIDVIDYFLEYQPKMKFTINGKQVCARKYVPKLPPPSSAAGTSRFFP